MKHPNSYVESLNLRIEDLVREPVRHRITGTDVMLIVSYDMDENKFKLWVQGIPYEQLQCIEK